MNKVTPIKSQKEVDQVRAFLVKETVKTLGITEDEARKRMDRLLDSGALDGLEPDNPLFRFWVDKYMKTPSNPSIQKQ